MSAPSDVLPSSSLKMVATRPSRAPLYLRATSCEVVVDMKEASTAPAKPCWSFSKNSGGSAKPDRPR